jgi:hypothetical protein
VCEKECRGKTYGVRYRHIDWAGVTIFGWHWLACGDDNLAPVYWTPNPVAAKMMAANQPTERWLVDDYNEPVEHIRIESQAVEVPENGVAACAIPL